MASRLPFPTLFSLASRLVSCLLYPIIRWQILPIPRCWQKHIPSAWSGRIRPLPACWRSLLRRVRAMCALVLKGVGSAEQVSGAPLARAAGAAKLDHIPYRGTAPALQDLLAGQIDKLNAPITTLVGQLRDGSLRMLSTSSEARVSGFPDVPALAERGARLAAAIAPIARSEAVQSRFVEFASMPSSPTPAGADFTSFVASFRGHWVAMAHAEGMWPGDIA